MNPISESQADKLIQFTDYRDSNQRGQFIRVYLLIDENSDTTLSGAVSDDQYIWLPLSKMLQSPIDMPGATTQELIREQYPQSQLNITERRFLPRAFEI